MLVVVLYDAIAFDVLALMFAFTDAEISTVDEEPSRDVALAAALTDVLKLVIFAEAELPTFVDAEAVALIVEFTILLLLQSKFALMLISVHEVEEAVALHPASFIDALTVLLLLEVFMIGTWHHGH